MANNKNNEAAPQETQLTKAEGFFLKNKKVIGGAVLAIVIVVIGAFCYKNFIAEPKAKEASTQLAVAQTSFEMTQVGAPLDSMMQKNYEAALNGVKGKSVGFLQIIENNGGTEAANLAHLYAGICYYNLGKNQEAQKHLEAYDTKDDALVSPASQMMLGDVYANLKQLDKAVDAFKKAAKMFDAASKIGHNDSMSPLALLKAGKILENQNKQAEALEIYKSIKEVYVSSDPSLQQQVNPELQEIDKYIERCTK